VGANDNKQTSHSNIYHATSELLSVEKDLPAYNEYLVRRFIEDFSRSSDATIDGRKVLDFGAGIGTLSMLWRELGQKPTPVCFEIDPNQIEMLKKRNFEVINKVNQTTDKFDFIVTSNALEHIEFDELVLKDLNDITKIHGCLVIFVPAFQGLFSELDSVAGHYRRYSKNELKTKLTNCGFKIEKFEFVDSIGFFAAFMLKILGWKKLGNLGATRSLKFYDRYIFPLSKVADLIGMKYLFGKNIYIVATKCTQAD